MATTIWKGHITFGLVSIPVKLYRAARPEKVSFRQLHAATGKRVRQALIAEPAPENEEEPERLPLARSATTRVAPDPVPFIATAPTPMNLKGSWSTSSPHFVREPEPQSQPNIISRAEILKGYEYEPDRYVALTKDELAAIAPQTAREMKIIEFVQISEVDPLYYESSYYVVPDKSGERAYSLLLEALRQSGVVGVAQVAMHNREHVVIIRPGHRGLLLHTMFYESEIRRNDEYAANVSAIAPKELELAMLLVGALKAPFEPAKYRDTYREKLEALIQAKITGNETVQAPAVKQAAVVNILEALQRSLQITGAPTPKPPVVERRSSADASKRSSRQRSEGK
ncbi:MAG: Ku protein [Bryobacteraceae bacterium]